MAGEGHIVIISEEEAQVARLKLLGRLDLPLAEVPVRAEPEPALLGVARVLRGGQHDPGAAHGEVREFRCGEASVELRAP